MIKALMKNQKGMTFIEVIVVTAIIAAITGAFSSSIFGIFRHTESSNAHMTAASAIENAAHRISNDGQMAQNTDLIPGAAAVSSITLYWTDPISSDSYEIYYFLAANNIQRRESVNSIEQNTQTVARYITSIGFYQEAGDERLFTVTITSSGSSPRVNETREYHILLRATD